MDTIIKLRVKKFAESLGIDESEYQDGALFELYIASVYLKKYIKDDLDLMHLVRTGGDDGGIDIAAVIINGVIVTDVSDVENSLNDSEENRLNLILIQVKSATKFDAKLTAKFLHGVDQIARTINKSDIADLDHGLINVVEILNECLNYINRFDISSIPVELYYVTTAQHDQKSVRNDKQVKKAIEDIRDKNVFQEGFDIKFHGKKDIIDRVSDNSGPQKVSFKFERKVSIPNAQGINQAYIGVLSIDDLLLILTEEDPLLGGKRRMRDQIFDDNVRLFQGENNPVNKKIMSTLASSQRKSFPFLNNGITVVARKVEPIGELFTISGYQIVNGCQTSNQIVNWIRSDYFAGDESHLEQLKEVWIPIKLIETKDNEKLEEITLSTNTQTSINSTDMQSVREHAKEVEEYFAESGSEGLRYARQSVVDDGTKDFPHMRTFDTEKLNRAFASCVYGESSTATGSPVDLKKPESYVWKEHPPVLYYFSCAILFRIDRYLSTKGVTGLRPAKYHIAMLVSVLLYSDLRRFYNQKNDTKILDKLAKRMDEAKKFHSVIKGKLQLDIDRNIPTAIEVVKNYFSEGLEGGKSLTKDKVRARRHQESLLKLLDDMVGS